MWWLIRLGAQRSFLSLNYDHFSEPCEGIWISKLSLVVAFGRRYNNRSLDVVAVAKFICHLPADTQRTNDISTFTWKEFYSIQLSRMINKHRFNFIFFILISIVKIKAKIVKLVENSISKGIEKVRGDIVAITWGGCEIIERNEEYQMRVDLCRTYCSDQIP